VLFAFGHHDLSCDANMAIKAGFDGRNVIVLGHNLFYCAFHNFFTNFHHAKIAKISYPWKEKKPSKKNPFRHLNSIGNIEILLKF